MRILVTADWHLEFWTHRDPLATLLPVLPALDALIIAGDLANDPLNRWPEALVRIGRLINPAKVFLIPGNHDYYRFRLDGDDRLRAIAEAAGMRFAQKRMLTFGTIRLLCCTLWSDFRLTGDRAGAMRMAARAMNDYRLIARDASDTRARPEDTLTLHEDHLAWLTEAIARPFPRRTVIVTHHGPSPGASGPIDGLTPAFTSDLDAWILRHRPDLWLFGHTHRHLRTEVGRTPVVNVSLGYPDEIRSGQEASILMRGMIDTGREGLLVYAQDSEEA